MACKDSSRSMFPCSQCGLCCQHVNLTSETRFLDRGDGTCRHYDAATKGCAVYTNRPDICRVDRQYDFNYAHLHTWDEFVVLNIEACELLQDVDRSGVCIEPNTQSR